MRPFSSLVMGLPSNSEGMSDQISSCKNRIKRAWRRAFAAGEMLLSLCLGWSIVWRTICRLLWCQNGWSVGGCQPLQRPYLVNRRCRFAALRHPMAPLGPVPLRGERHVSDHPSPSITIPSTTPCARDRASMAVTAAMSSPPARRGSTQRCGEVACFSSAVTAETRRDPSSAMPRSG